MASPASSYQTTSANQKPLLLQLKLWSCKCSDTTSDIEWKNLAANHLAAMNLQLDNQTVAAWQLRFFWRPDLPGFVISHGTSRPHSRSQVTHGRKSTTATGALEELPACCCIFTRIEHSKKTASVIIGNSVIIQWLHSARCLAYITRISNISVYQRGPCCFHLL